MYGTPSRFGYLLIISWCGKCKMICIHFLVLVSKHSHFVCSVAWFCICHDVCFRSKYVGCCQKPRWSSSPPKSLYSWYLLRLLPAHGTTIPVRKSGGCCTIHGPHRQCGQGGCSGEPLIVGWSLQQYPVVPNRNP